MGGGASVYALPHGSTGDRLAAHRRGGAAGEEGGSRDLRHLAAGGVIVRAEVGAIARRDARLERPTARIAVDDAATGDPLDVEVEGTTGGHILERLGGRRFGPARCAG